ncbi:hypothetical protein NP493_478g03003 [Ridgeia piscesae]|uniref:Uncharacterized protein n=1 Tax=Ridgeia piscesae TaxID=27915 RepID=A0AAD9KZI6_RIDPI|nr:hypothetical protein NP493_478g03003 [Ridgeia piscesae]
MSSRLLVYKLNQAVSMKDATRMEAAIRECKEAGMGKEKDVRKAEKELQVIEMKSKLKRAMEERDDAAITEAISETERLGLSSKLRHDILAAKNSVSRRERTAQSKPSILDFGKSTISEIRSYDHPPRIVHRVIQAALMLLGESESDTSDWRKCRAFCCQTGDNGLNRKILNFDMTKVRPGAKPISKEILNKYRFSEVQAVSAGAATFYVWVSCFFNVYITWRK